MIKINYACPKAWDSMDEVDNNVRHCDQCSMKVKDFSKDKVDSLDGFDCGRFQLSQVDKVSHSFSLSKASLYTTSLLAALGAVATTNTAQAQSTEKSILLKSKKKNQVHIRGLIKDKNTNETLPFVNVIAKFEGQIISGTTSDHDGKFKMLIDTAAVDFKSIFLEFNTIGYQKDSLSVMEIKDELLDQDLVIDMESNINVVEGEGIMMGFVLTGEVEIKEEKQEKEELIDVKIEDEEEEQEPNKKKKD